MGNSRAVAWVVEVHCEGGNRVVSQFSDGSASEIHAYDDLGNAELMKLPRLRQREAADYLKGDSKSLLGDRLGPPEQNVVVHHLPVGRPLIIAQMQDDVVRAEVAGAFRRIDLALDV